MNKEPENKNHKHTVHFVLVQSYLVFLLAILIGVFFDTLLKGKLFSNDIYKYIGFLMLIISSLVIFWAQNTSHDYKNKKLKDESMSHFEHGPYKYLRNPTHLSVFIMTLGFGLIINSFFSIIFATVAYVLTKILFLRKEEKMLEKKYGETYVGYKKKVKNWI